MCWYSQYLHTSHNALDTGGNSTVVLIVSKAMKKWGKKMTSLRKYHWRLGQGSAFILITAVNYNKRVLLFEFAAAR